MNVRTALLVILLGVACAAVSRLFCYTLHFMEHTVPKLLPNPWVRVFAGGVLVIGFSYLFGVGRYNGAGMGVITAAVEQGQALPWDFLCKIFLTALTLACGFKGGEVVPSFFVGATFGCVVGPLLGLPAEFAAAVGLVSIFCGATNVLIPSILLGFELFSGAGWSSSRWAAVSALCSPATTACTAARPLLPTNCARSICPTSGA